MRRVITAMMRVRSSAILLCAALTIGNAGHVAAQDQRPDQSDGRLAAPELLLNVSAAAAAAAAAQPAPVIPTPEHTGFKAFAIDLFDDVKHLPSTENIWWAATSGAGALAVHPADKHVTPYFKDASWAHDVFKFGAFLGNTPTLLVISGSVYAFGRITDQKRTSHLGMDLLQSLIVSNVLVQTLKYATQRERPDGSGHTSFPSGHSADTLAVATALERHLNWKAVVPAYAFASYVAMSRLHDNRHYLSDVIFGAGVGIISGRTVTRHGRDFPLAVVPVPGGAAVTYTRNNN